MHVKLAHDKKKKKNKQALATAHVSTGNGEVAGGPCPLLSERSCTRQAALELTSDCVEASSSDPSSSGGDNNEMRKEERRSK